MSNDAARWAQAITNEDVAWDGSLIGLVPTMAGPAARELLALGDAALPALLEALADEQRFVAAHVLATLIAGLPQGGEGWNGLGVELPAGGGVRIDARQRHALARRWQAWQRASPRPAALPPAAA